MPATHRTDTRMHRLISRHATVPLAAIAVFVLGIGAKAAAHEARGPEQPGHTKDQIEHEFAERIEEYNELLKQSRFEEAVVAAKQAQALQPDNPMNERMVQRAES